MVLMMRRSALLRAATKPRALVRSPSSLYCLPVYVLHSRWRPRCGVQHTVRRIGEPETSECRYFFFDRMGRKQSPWHHIPLYSPLLNASAPHQTAGNIFHFVNEIPKG